MSDEQRLPRLFWFLFAGAFINRIGSFVLPLFAIYLMRERGFDATTTGIICSLYGLGSLASGQLGGQLADRLGRRRTMLIGFTWGAAAMLLVPQASGPIALGAASFHLGLSGDLYRPAIMAAVADLCPPALRPRAYGLLYWAVNLGFAVASALGGALSSRGFGLLFVIDAATTIGFALIVLVFVPETRPGDRREEPAGAAPTMWVALTDPVLVRVVATQCLVGVLFLQAQVTLPISLGHRGIDAATYGLVIASNGVLIVALQPFAARVLARLRRTQALALAAILVGGGFAWNVLPLGVAGALISVALWTLGEIICSPVLPAVIADLAPPALRGRYQGVQQMSFGVCALLGPAGGMLLYERGGDRLLWGACLAFGVAAAALHLASARVLAARLVGRGAPA